MRWTCGEALDPCGPCDGLSVFALGPLRVFAGGRELLEDVWRGRKGQLLLKYLLACGPGEWVPKKTVLDALWAGRDPARSGQCLRAAVSNLRRTLEPDLLSSLPSSYILSKGGRCMLRLGADRRYYYDVEDFTGALAAAADLGREGKDHHAAERYYTAVSLYRGDFLHGEPHADWISPSRERLQELYADALIHLGTYELSRGDVAAASDLALQVLEIEPVCDRGYGLAIACYARTGQWGRVMSLYDCYRNGMQKQGRAPQGNLRDLLARLNLAGDLSRLS